MTYPGIDYGRHGDANRNPETGIHYGIIPAGAEGFYFYEEAEANYGDPHCPACGDEFTGDDGDACECGHVVEWVGEECYGDEPVSWYVDGDVKMESAGYGDVFVFDSPYFTHSQFCSPCAPGAGYLLNPCDDGPKTYCPGPDWFEDGKAPYPVYRVADGSRVA